MLFFPHIKPLLIPFPPPAAISFLFSFDHKTPWKICLHCLQPPLSPFSWTRGFCLLRSPSDLYQVWLSVLSPHHSCPISKLAKVTTSFSLKHSLYLPSSILHSPGFSPTHLLLFLSVLCWFLLIFWPRPHNAGLLPLFHLHSLSWWSHSVSWF